MRIDKIHFFSYFLVLLAMILAWFGGVESCNFQNLLLILVSTIAFGVPLLLSRNINEDIKPIAITYLLYSNIFYGMSVINFIIDPKIGRYFQLAPRINAYDFILCLFICMAFSSILIVSLYNFTLKNQKYKLINIKLSSEFFKYINYFRFIVVFFVLLKIVAIYYLGSPLLLGGLQNRGDIDIFSILTPLDPSIPLMIYLYIKNYSKGVVSFSRADAILLVTFLAVSLAGGSKEGGLRLLYIILGLYLLISPKYTIKKKNLVMVGILMPIVGVLLAVVGHGVRSYLVTGDIDLSYGGGDDILKFLLSRLGGMDDLVLAIHQLPKDLSEYYGPINILMSSINLMVPGNPFDILPLTLYFSYFFKGVSMDDVKYIYSSSELSLPGAILLNSGGPVGAVIMMLFISLLIVVIIKIFKDSNNFKIYILMVVYNMSYVVRSLSLDDTFFSLSFSLIMTYIILNFVKFMSSFKLTRSLRNQAHNQRQAPDM